MQSYKIELQVGLNINTDKTKVMKINARSDQKVTIHNKNIEEVREFVYLGSKITTDGNSRQKGNLRFFRTSGGFQGLAPNPNLRFLRAMFLESFYIAQSPERCHNPYATR